jgi:hypothetical protein
VARPGTLACALLAAMGAIAVWFFWSTASEANVPQYQRRAAFAAACSVAAEEISGRRQQALIRFVDDCRRPNITPFSSKPGLLIVTRVIEEQLGQATVRRTYSALMDGRRIDAWQMIRIESAPNELSVVVSPPALLATEEVAEQSGQKPARSD